MKHKLQYNEHALTDRHICKNYERLVCFSVRIFLKHYFDFKNTDYTANIAKYKSSASWPSGTARGSKSEDASSIIIATRRMHTIFVCGSRESWKERKFNSPSLSFVFSIQIH